MGGGRAVPHRGADATQSYGALGGGSYDTRGPSGAVGSSPTPPGAAICSRSQRSRRNLASPDDVLIGQGMLIN